MKPEEKLLRNVARNALLLKPGEKVVIVYDKNKAAIAKGFASACANEGADVSMCKIKERTETNREPPASVLKKMISADVVLAITTISMTHTEAVRNAKARGARVASMPGITKEMYPALGVDYRKMKKLCRRIAKFYRGVKRIRVKTELGTDIEMRMDKRRVQIDDGLLDHPDTLHNLPAGEVGIAPLEDSANGKIVVDVCIVGPSRMYSLITLEVKDGRLIKISGKGAAKALRSVFDKADKNGRTIAEFSIGANKNARIIGKVLNDEKAYGTCHMAFGDNKSMGGKTKSNIHIDGVVNKPTIWFDKKMIMKKGKLVV